MLIDRTSPLPYYAQLEDLLRQKIEQGLWRTGDQIPSEPELCKQFQVSRTVVRQALKDLAYAGLLVREKGRGTFVAEPKIDEGLVQELTGFYQDMQKRGFDTESQVLKQALAPASPKVAGFLQIEPGAMVIEIRRLRFVQSEPHVLVTTYLPYAACPQLLEADLRRQSLYNFIEQHCGLVIDRGRRTIEAVAANSEEAALLQVAEGSPLILINNLSCLADGKPIEYYHAVHRGDRTRFEVELVRRTKNEGS